MFVNGPLDVAFGQRNFYFDAEEKVDLQTYLFRLGKRNDVRFGLIGCDLSS